MIQLIEKKTRNRGPVCGACIKEWQIVDVDMCEICVGRVMTVYKCPKCTTVRNYFAGQAPDVCPTCKTIFPDFNDLLHTRYARVDYHLDKEIY